MITNQEQSAANSSKILLVEDSGDLRTLILEALRIEGYSIEGVRNGVEALDYLADHEAPDLILCDLMMPDMDGAELIRRLRGDPKWSKTRMLVISGANQLESKAAAAGADGYIAKPFDIDKLYHSVAKGLKH